jgi:YVTN family beta-propeller protein
MSTWKTILVLVLAVLAVSGACPAEEDGAIPFYVGAGVCAECHAPSHPAGPCALGPIPAHDGAHGALLKEEAAHIAALSGVVGPSRGSRTCLGCHATAADVGPRWTEATFDVTDGVQCEACHGAGSLHVRRHRQSDAALPEPGGFDRLRSPDRSECAACHRPLESHRAVLEQGYRRPAVDHLYRTPVNLAVSPRGDRLYVVCANADRLLVVDPAAGAVLEEIAVGRRPHDVAVSPDGSRLYVTNRFADSLSVIDAASHSVIAEIAVGDDPHGVLTDAEGRLVYVLATAQDSVSVIDARDLIEVGRLAAGRGPWSLALDPEGDVMYVTNSWPRPATFRDAPRSEVTALALRPRPTVRDRPVVDEANMLQGIAVVPRSDVALFTLMRPKNLVPITRLAQGWTITNGLGILRRDGRVDQVLLDRPGESFPDPTDVAVGPDGRFALVTSGGADEVAVVDVAAMLATVDAASDRERAEILPNHLGTSARFVRTRIPVGSNPRGLAFAPDGRLAYVANALDDSVTVIDTDGFTAIREIDLGGPDEVSETRRGERLFRSAAVTAHRQFSCRTCHPDGHDNGLTFDIEPDGLGMSPVDNRTLRGILDTAPFKWEGTNPTLSRQCGPRLAVFFTRLQPFTPDELAALVRYISTIERPPNRHRRPDGLTPAQRRGKIVFDRVATNFGRPIPPEHRCVTCHSGPYGTSGTKDHVGTTMWFDAPVDPAAVDLADVSADVEQHGTLGLYYYVDTGTPTRSFDVPHLSNIHDSPPYLHNGAAATLEEIWTRFDVLTLHGVTGDLTRQQFNDLIAYLEAF